VRVEYPPQMFTPLEDSADPAPERLSISLSPRGRLSLRAAEEGEAALDAAAVRRLWRAFQEDDGEGLFHLGAAEVATALPPAFAFWRDLASSFAAAVCATPDLEEVREGLDVAAPPEALERLLAAAPPMLGGEYLGLEVLRSAWARMLEFLRAEIRETEEPVQKLLSRWHPSWNVVGRVHFSLAENRRNLERNSWYYGKGGWSSKETAPAWKLPRIPTLPCS